MIFLLILVFLTSSLIAVFDDLAKYMPKNPVILECGAHNGSDTVTLYNKFAPEKIYAFEAAPEVFNNLKRRVDSFSNIIPLNFALSNIDNSDSVMYISGSDNYLDFSSSLLEPKDHLMYNPQVVFDSTAIVKTKILDIWAKENKVEKIDFMWLDAQGSEFNILSSSPNMLKTCKVIYTEVNFTEVYKDVTLYPDFKKFMLENGFQVVKEWFIYRDQGDVLFVKTDWLKELGFID